MTRHRRPLSPPGVLAAGLAVGALSWLGPALISGAFEPYDTGLGLLANQFLLCVPVAVLAWRCQVAAAFIFLIGAYVGMNAYAYGFGGSETRAWAALGAVVSLLLLLLPAVLAATVLLFRRMLPGPAEADDAG